MEHDVLPEPRRRVWRSIGAVVSGLLLWSLASAPSVVSQEEPVEEPPELAAYATFADAAPVQAYFDHQVRLVPLGPALAHTQSEVLLPSSASGIAWLVENGIANGLHGTTTGSKVPTEASAKQPGGDPREEFSTAGGPIGSDALLRVQAGRALASATHSAEPRGYANAFFGNVWLLPAPGGPADPPGTFDPNATFPGGDPDETDPQPRGQMAVLAIGKAASTSQSIREGRTVTSVAVAELKDINIGNRTADNRCANCIRIDWIRAEAYAQASGERGGSKAAYRVTAGRACRRTFSADRGEEIDQCFPLNPRDHESPKGLQSVDELEKLNEQFGRPFWYQATNGAIDYTIGIQIHAGSEHREPSRARRTVTPPDDVHRNYAYPDRGDRDRDRGEVAKAVAEGIDIEVTTITASQVADDAERRIAGTPAQRLLDEVDEDDEAPGIQVNTGPLRPATGTVTIPTETIRSARRVNVTIGVARAVAVARAAAEVLGTELGAQPPATTFTGGDAGGAPVEAGEPGVPEPPAGGAPAAFLPSGKIEIDWATFRIRLWPAYDVAKVGFAGAMAAAAALLIRRRLRIAALRRPRAG